MITVEDVIKAKSGKGNSSTIFDSTDLKKVEAEISRINDEINRVRILEKDLEMLNTFKQIRLWYLDEKSNCENAVDCTVDGKATGEKIAPFASDQARRNYNWLKKFPYLALRKGLGGSQNLVCAYNIQGVQLETESKMLMDSFEKTNEYKSLCKFLVRFQKNKS